MKSIQKHALINGRIRTMDADCSLAEAVLVAGDRIESIGTTAEILAAAGKDARVTDLGGKALFPGFIDSHSHLSMYSAWSEHVYCGAEVKTLEGALERLRERAKITAPGELILGWGFDDTILPEGRGPTRKELDAVSTANPILLVHISVHASYANSTALQIAELDAKTEIQGGEVVLDDNGDPLGTLLEMASFKAMDALCPKTTPERLRSVLRSGITSYNSYGITSTHEAGVGLGGINAAMYMRVLREMENDGELDLRLYLSFMPADFDKYAASGIATGFGSKMVTFCGPKLFNDGSIQAHTAALLEPYHDWPDHKPDVLIPVAEMTETIVRYHCDGYQVTYHGNGDAGIEVMIAAIEKAQQICPRRSPPHPRSLPDRFGRPACAYEEGRHCAFVLRPAHLVLRRPPLRILPWPQAGGTA